METSVHFSLALMSVSRPVVMFVTCWHACPGWLLLWWFNTGMWRWHSNHANTCCFLLLWQTSKYFCSYGLILMHCCCISMLIGVCVCVCTKTYSLALFAIAFYLTTLTFAAVCIYIYIWFFPQFFIDQFSIVFTPLLLVLYFFQIFNSD